MAGWTDVCYIVMKAVRSTVFQGSRLIAYYIVTNEGCRLNCVPRVSVQGSAFDSSLVGASYLRSNRTKRSEDKQQEVPCGHFMGKGSLPPSRPADHLWPLVALPCPQDCNSVARFVCNSSALQVHRESW